MVMLKLKNINFTAIKALYLEDVDIQKALVSNKVSSGEKSYKYFIDYLYDDHKVKPLHIMLPRSSTFVKGYDRQTRWMYFFIKHDEYLLEKSNTIWDKVSADIKKEFDRKPVQSGTPRRIHVDSTLISRRYVEDQILTNFHVIFTSFFDVILLIEKSTSFPSTFFDVILMVEKSTLFPRTFFDVISMVEKSTLFPRTVIDVILLNEKPTLFPRIFSM